MTRLGDVCAIRYGKDHKKLSDGSIPAYGSGGIIRYVDTAICEQPSVLIPRKGTLGNLFYTDEPFWTVDTLFWTDIDQTKIVPKYLYYQLKQKDLASYNVGTAVPSLTVEVLNEIDLDVPSIDKQRRIVEVLNSFDSKIALNNQLNDYLANLLDAAFANSAKSGSKEFGLPEVVDILSGGTPKTKNAEYWEDGRIPFFTPGDVTNSVYTLTTEKHITDVGLDNCNSELYPVDTVFLTARGTVGKVAIAGRPMAMNQSCFAFRGKSIPQSVVFQIIKNAVKTLRAKANGATFAAINTRDLKIETVAVPCNKEIAHYDESASKWLDLIRTNEEENLQLSALRDILLPKLMSGEIDVSKVDLTQLTNNHLAGRMHWSTVIRVRAIHAVHSRQSQIPAYESVPRVLHSHVTPP